MLFSVCHGIDESLFYGADPNRLKEYPEDAAAAKGAHVRLPLWLKSSGKFVD